MRRLAWDGRCKHNHGCLPRQCGVWAIIPDGFGGIGEANIISYVAPGPPVRQWCGAVRVVCAPHSSCLPDHPTACKRPTLVSELLPGRHSSSSATAARPSQSHQLRPSAPGVFHSTLPPVYALGSVWMVCVLPDLSFILPNQPSNFFHSFFHTPHPRSAAVLLPP